MPPGSPIADSPAPSTGSSASGHVRKYAHIQPYLRTRPLAVPRRARAAIRPIEPDAMHRSRLVQQVINKVMTHGKKSIAEQSVYDSLAIVAERTGRPPVEVLDEAIKA